MVMRQLRYITIILISFGFGVIVGYSAHGYPTFENIKSFILTGLSVGGALSLIIEGIGILRDYLKEKNEKLLSHSKLLVDKNLKFRTNTGIYFAHDNSLDLQIKTEFSYDKLEYNSDFDYLSDKPYSYEVDAHLENGYLKEAWKHKKERDDYINKHNALSKEFLRNLIEG